MIVIWGKQGEEGKRTNVEVKDAPQMVDDQLDAAMSPLKSKNTCQSQTPIAARNHCSR